MRERGRILTKKLKIFRSCALVSSLASSEQTRGLLLSTAHNKNLQVFVRLSRLSEAPTGGIKI